MKVCERCGASFPRPRSFSARQWAARRYCSLACSRPTHGACAVTACVNPSRGTHGLCNLHRQRQQRHGDPAHERWPTLLARVMSKVKKGACWTWRGSVFAKSGYGQVWADGTNRLAHRVVYELLVGEIPAGLELDHLCRNRRCVNPAHLEPVTTRENLRRMRLALKGGTAS